MSTHINKVLKKLEIETKEAMLKKLHLTVANADSHEELGNAIKDAMEERGILHMLDDLEAETLAKVYAIAFPKEKGKEKEKEEKVTKSAMIKRIADKISESNFNDWIATLDADIASTIAKSLDIQ